MATRARRSAVAGFSVALSKWLEEQKFTIGVPLDDVGMDAAAVKEASGWVGAAAKAAGIHVPEGLISFFLTTGAPREQVEEALFPYLDNADLVAFHVAGNVTIVPVIYAEGLREDDILERLATFIEESPPLSDLGLRFILSSRSPASVYLYPLLVFSSSKACIDTWHSISDRAWFAHQIVSMRAGFIDLSTPHVQWSEPTNKAYHMLKPVIDRLNSIGHKEFPLNNAVLTALLAKSKPPTKAKRKRPIAKPVAKKKR